MVVARRIGADRAVRSGGVVNIRSIAVPNESHLSAHHVLVCHCARGGINCLAGRDCLGLGSSVNAQNASLFPVAKHELDSAICIMSLD
jgi:hypothetical protein